jgi:hypothetical protein
MQQVKAEIPKMRLMPYEPPFTRIGLDCFGPLMIKRGRSTIKRWGVLFICLNARAIHLEAVESMDTSSFLNALRRFIVRLVNRRIYGRIMAPTLLVGSESSEKLCRNGIGVRLRRNSINNVCSGISSTLAPHTCQVCGSIWLTRSS